MECHGLEMIGNFRSADDIDAIEIEAGTGKVIINNALDLDFGTPPVTAYDKVLTSDADGNATWQTRSIVKDTVMLFLMGTPPTGWTKNDTFVHYSMLIYRDPGMGFNSGGSDLPTFFTINTTTNTTGSDHTHIYSFNTAPYSGNDLRDAGKGDDRLVRSGHYHTLSGAVYDTGSTHTHTMTTDTYSPKYQTIIAATKN